MRKNQGFTLIELLMTVAIMSVLVSFGQETFASFKAKSHKAEAKFFIAHTYLAMELHLEQWGVYTSCLADYSTFSLPEERLYGVGFAELDIQFEADKVIPLGFNCTKGWGNTSWALYPSKTINPIWNQFLNGKTWSGDVPGVKDSGNGFLIAVFGCIGDGRCQSGTGKPANVFTLNENKQVLEIWN
jgi:prepilin-type N-terminal cleavage/methylation domain-containing protein